MDTRFETGAPTVSTELRGSWRYLMGAGIVVSILGILAIAAPVVGGIALSMLFGTFLVIGGLVHLSHAFSARGWSAVTWEFLLAGVYVVAGVALALDPIFGLATLTLLLVAFFAVGGVAEVGLGLRMRPEPRWGAVVASGLVSVLLAVLLWVGFPSTARWAVGLLLGVGLLFSGVALIAVANAGRKATAMGETDRPESSHGV